MKITREDLWHFAVVLLYLAAFAGLTLLALYGCASCPAQKPPPFTASEPIDPHAQGSPINDTLGIDMRCWNPDWCNVTTCTTPAPGEYPSCQRTTAMCMRPTSCP